MGFCCKRSHIASGVAREIIISISNNQLQKVEISHQQKNFGKQPSAFPQNFNPLVMIYEKCRGH